MPVRAGQGGRYASAPSPGNRLMALPTPFTGAGSDRVASDAAPHFTLHHARPSNPDNCTYSGMCDRSNERKLPRSADFATLRVSSSLVASIQFHVADKRQMNWNVSPRNADSF